MSILNSWLFKKPIAHRGLHDDAFPENSLGAFQNAVEKGYPIELDVRSIDDNTVIVFHDEKLGRMTDNDGYVCNISKEDLSDLHLYKSQYTIPSFEEVLALVNGQTEILIEIKNDAKVGGLEKRVLDMLKGYNGDYAVQSFNPYSMEYFKRNAPQIMRGQLSCIFGKGDLGFWKRLLLSRLKMNHVSSPNFISYSHDALPNKYVTKTALPTLAWTVRSESEQDRVADFCNNIIFEKFNPSILR